MQSIMGLGYRLSKNPYWFNAYTGQLVQTGSIHHSRVFFTEPTILGIKPEDVGIKYRGELYTNIYADVMLERGWCRIDFPNGIDRVVGQYDPLPSGTVAILAPNVEAADAALQEAGRLATTQLTRAIVVISPRATKTREGFQRLDLSGPTLIEAVTQGLSGLSSRSHSTIPGSDLAAGRSKMRPTQHRCPFGFGGR